ncbi:MAG TPA: hydroxyisourate hydrolase [Candidatus Acidoferrum sp.]
MSQITTHVLDTSLGRPAANVPVILEAQIAGGDWKELSRGSTDSDGRLKDFATGKPLEAGRYRLTFDTRDYFAEQKMDGFYPQVTIVFEVKNPRERYHVPLLLSPYGYSTYRGS